MISLSIIVVIFWMRIHIDDMRRIQKLEMDGLLKEAKNIQERRDHNESSEYFDRLSELDRSDPCKHWFYRSH